MSAALDPPPPISRAREALAVATGGAVGALARFAVEIVVAAGLGEAVAATSLALLSVNTVGSLGLGALTGRLERRPAAPAWLRPLLGVGLCGAFTTFSGFAGHLGTLHAESGPRATAVFLIASCVAGALAYHAGRDGLGSREEAPQ